MLIEVKRESYTAQTTIGKLYIDGKYFCWCLEDTVRPRGIKVKGHTAIPAGVEFIVNVTFSNRFQRMMPSITTDGHYTLEAEGIKFKGVRAHGGNTHVNTDGCPLVAKRKLNNDTIQGTMEKELTKLIQQALDTGEQVRWIAYNLPQAA